MEKHVTIREVQEADQIDQSPAILQQIIGRTPPAGGNFVQIVYLNNHVPSGTQNMTEPEIMRNLLCRLQPPRLENLKQLAYEVAMVKHGGNKFKAAEWLGITYRTMYEKEKERNAQSSSDAVIVE